MPIHEPTERVKSDRLSSLPDELLLHILDSCDPEDVKALRRASKRFNGVSLSSLKDRITFQQAEIRELATRGLDILLPKDRGIYEQNIESLGYYRATYRPKIYSVSALILKIIPERHEDFWIGTKVPSNSLVAVMNYAKPIKEDFSNPVTLNPKYISGELEKASQNIVMFHNKIDIIDYCAKLMMTLFEKNVGRLAKIDHIAASGYAAERNSPTLDRQVGERMQSIANIPERLRTLRSGELSKPVNSRSSNMTPPDQSTNEPLNTKSRPVREFIDTTELARSFARLTLEDRPVGSDRSL